RHAPWQIVLFSMGMYMVVYGLGNAGLTNLGAAALHWLAQQGDLVATVGTGFLSAVVASIMNNMPSTLVGALAIDQAQVSATTRWAHVLADTGDRVASGPCAAIGFLPTPPVLFASLLALAWWLPAIAVQRG